MKEKDQVLQDNFGIQLPSVRQESCIVTAILMVFNSSYALRVFWELVPKDACTSFQYYMLSQFSGVPFDMIPILLIVILHRKNFSAAKEEHNLQRSCSVTSDTKLLTMP